jgi:hypothetical protein
MDPLKHEFMPEGRDNAHDEQFAFRHSDADCRYRSDARIVFDRDLDI